MSQNDIYRVTAVFTDSAVPKTYTTSFYLKQTTVVGFSVGDIGDLVKLWWNTAYASGVAMKSLYSTGMSLVEVTMRKWFPLSPTIDVYTTGLPVAGTVTGDNLPGENAVLLSLRTANIGRSYRGRMYLPPITETNLAGQLSSGTATTIAEQFVGLVRDLQTTGAAGAARADTVVWSRVLSASSLVTQVKCDEIIRSQRRRNQRLAEYVSSDV